MKTYTKCVCEVTKSKVFLKIIILEMSLLTLKVQTSKYYLHQLKVQISESTPVAVVAAAVGRYRGGRGAAALLWRLAGRSAAEDATGVGRALCCYLFVSNTRR